MLVKYLRFLGAPSVQLCCTLWISASYRVYICGRYKKSRHVCMWLSDLEFYRHRPFLCGAVPAIQQIRRGRERSTQIVQQFSKAAVTAPRLVGCVVWILPSLVFICWHGVYQPVAIFHGWIAEEVDCELSSYQG